LGKSPLSPLVCKADCSVFKASKAASEGETGGFAFVPPSVPRVSTQHVGLPADTSTVRQNFLSGLDGTIRAASQPNPARHPQRDR